MRSTENSQNNVPLADWTRCPPGELQRLVGRLNGIEHSAKRKRIYFRGTGAMLLIAGLAVGVGTLLTPKMSNSGDLTCQQCQSHFVAYHNHLTGSTDNGAGSDNGADSSMKRPGGSEAMEIIDSTMAEKMKTHLAKCGQCRAMFNRQYPDGQYPGRLANHWSRGVSQLALRQAPTLFAVIGVPAAI